MKNFYLSAVVQEERMVGGRWKIVSIPLLGSNHLVSVYALCPFLFQLGESPLTQLNPPGSTLHLLVLLSQTCSEIVLHCNGLVGKTHSTCKTYVRKNAWEAFTSKILYD